MAESHRRFGELLKEGIKRVQIRRDKPIGVILDEFGYELRPEEGAKGRYALGHWYYKKRIPADLADVEKLARLIVLNSDVEREWLLHFLESAGHPDPDKFCNKFFITVPGEHQPSAEMPAPQIVQPSLKPEPLEDASQPELPGSPLPTPQSRLPRSIIWLVVVLAVFVIGFVIFRPLLFPPAEAELPASPTALTSNPALASDLTATEAATQTKVPTAVPSSTSAPPATTAPPTPSPSPQVLVFDGRCPTSSSVEPFVYTDLASIAAFLNSGGTPAQLITAFNQQAAQNPELRNGQVSQADLTGDGVDEIVVNLLTGSGSLWQVLACHDGAYLPLWQDEPADVVLLQTITHLNANSRADIIRYRVNQGEDAPSYEYSILEWSGSQFRELMDPQRFYQVAEELSVDIGPWELSIPNASATITDTNGDSIFELVVSGGLESPVLTCETVFQRQFSDTWVWDGTAYQFSERVYMPPLYRFQSNADGDLAFALRQYDRALVAYRETVFNLTLLPRSDYPDYLEHCARIGSPSFDFPLSPKDEALVLEAYARWRILLIQTILGYPDSMQVVYDTLKQRFPEGSVGYAYVAIATAFWDSYHETGDGTAACAEANRTAESQTLYPNQEARLICLWQ